MQPFDEFNGCITIGFKTRWNPKTSVARQNTLTTHMFA